MKTVCLKGAGKKLAFTGKVPRRLIVKDATVQVVEVQVCQISLGAIQVFKLRNAFFQKLDPHPPPRNANNSEPYTFVMVFSRKSDTPHPYLRYVTLEWPLVYNSRLATRLNPCHAHSPIC